MELNQETEAQSAAERQKLFLAIRELSLLAARVEAHPLGATFLLVHVELCRDALEALNDLLVRRM